jgi:two-component system phosphate regulon response regulator PhoB
MSEKRILVIEDDEATSELMRFLLEEEGYQVFTVPRGAKVFEAVTNCQPDLITLDINLPDVDGLHIYRQLLAQPELCHIPVVFVSVAEMRRDEGLKLGARSFVIKPFHLDELSRVVRETISSK